MHFEIMGRIRTNSGPTTAELFGWEFDTNAPVAEAVSQSGNYGFVNRNTTSDGTEIPGVVWATIAT